MLAVQPGDHISATFASASQFAETTIAFAGQALAASALVMIFPGDPDRDDLGAFRRRLGDRDAVMAAAAASGQVRIADSRQVQLAPGRFDPAHLREAYAAAAREAVRSGFRGLWVSVDMSWASAVDPDALTEFEAESATLFTSGDLTAVCLYDTRVFGEKQVAAACRAHPAGCDDRSPLRHRRLHNGRTLQLSGETDLANSAAFAALTRTLRPGDTLDITAMTFLDVRALAAIARGHTEGLTIRASRAQVELLDLIRAGDCFPSP